MDEIGETKIIYHIDEEETPYLVKVPVPPDRVTLGDFKNVLNRPNYKFFFKSMDDVFGVVKEEIVDEDAPLPCFNGRVVSWLVSADTSTVSDTTSQCTDSAPVLPPALERTAGIGDSRPPSFHAIGLQSRAMVGQGDTTCTETESVLSSRPGGHHHPSARHRRRYADAVHRINGKPHRHIGIGPGPGIESASMISSDLETTSFVDSDEDDASSRFTTTTEQTSVSRMNNRHQRRQRRRRHRMPVPMSRTSSLSSITDSTLSLNIITVTLNMDTVNFLGISIVGQSNKGGDGGIYVGSIMKGGAVALDGRIEPGDMILQVNDVNFENMSNDDAVRVLREAVQKPGPIKLVVAKCWDPNPKGYFTIPRTEPVRPIDPGAWVAHTAACQLEGDYPGRPPSVATLTSASTSIPSSVPDSERQYEETDKLTVLTDMRTIVKAMAMPDSGLEIRDRMWLKITIANAFIGADVVDWLFTHVEGFPDRREARKYASQLLKAGYIRHTVNKITFSEQCYYVFGDACAEFNHLRGQPADHGRMPGMVQPAGLPGVVGMSGVGLSMSGIVGPPDRDAISLGPLPTPQPQSVAWTMPTYVTGSYVGLPGAPMTSGSPAMSRASGGGSMGAPVVHIGPVPAVSMAGSSNYQQLPYGYEPEPPSYAVAVSRVTASVQSQGSGGSSGSERQRKAMTAGGLSLLSGMASLTLIDRRGTPPLNSGSDTESRRDSVRLNHLHNNVVLTSSESSEHSVSTIASSRAAPVATGVGGPPPTMAPPPPPPPPPRQPHAISGYEVSQNGAGGPVPLESLDEFQYIDKGVV